MTSDRAKIRLRFLEADQLKVEYLEAVMGRIYRRRLKQFLGILKKDIDIIRSGDVLGSEIVWACGRITKVRRI